MTSNPDTTAILSPDPEFLRWPTDCKAWILYTDGASNQTGCRAGIVLTDPEGIECSHCFRFKFKATNNEVEYEALLAGMKVVEELGADFLLDRSDSQLVITKYLPTLHQDAKQFAQSCEPRQKTANLHHLPLERLASISTPYPFAIWGLDLIGSLPTAPVAHPQTNGLVEATNKTIKKLLKKKLQQKKGKWAEELPNVLWVSRTTKRTTTGETPYSLAFGTKAVSHIEHRLTSFKVQHFELEDNETMLRVSLDLLEEKQDRAAEWVAAYQCKIARCFNRRVNTLNFKEGDLVLRKVTKNTWKRLRIEIRGPSCPPHPQDQESLYGPLEALDGEYPSLGEPGARVALVAYQDRSPKDHDTLSGYLIPHFAIHTYENLELKWP
ncbi:hypothetical protein Q3G72_027763 [Acer saccharum]|nr:hypothetical protein Q3G72_027763 [Acer saccharum]